MFPKKIKRNLWQGNILLFLFSLVFVLPGIYVNFYQVTPVKTFETAGKGSEFWMVGRLAHIRDHGFFSLGGLQRAVGPSPEGMRIQDFQYEVYFHDLPYSKTKLYKSQPGFQALPYHLITQLTGITGSRGLQVFYLLTAILMTLVLFLLGVWAKRHFGLLTAFLVLLAGFIFLWFNAFGKCIWFVFWVHYVPMLFVCFILYREMTGKKLRMVRTGILFFLLVQAKLLMTGFEFATSSLFMPLVPIVFYAIDQRWGWKKFLVRMAGAGLISLVAVLVTLIILAFQISQVAGSFSAGVEHLHHSFNKRADGDPENYKNNDLLYKSLQATGMDAIKIHWKKEAADLGFFLRKQGSSKLVARISYGHVVYFFVLISLLGLILRKEKPIDPGDKRTLDAILMTTWFSMIGPMSWFIIFKAHAFVHRELDMMVWHMPFIFFGFMLTGYLLRLAFQRNFLIKGNTRG